jgi:hypothetical protein
MRSKSTCVILCLQCCLAWTVLGQVNPNNPGGSPSKGGGSNNPNGGAVRSPATGGGAAHTTSPRSGAAPAPVHVYSKKADGWTELQADVANIEGGKHDAILATSTPGIIKAYVNGAHSETRLAAPSELSVSAPEGFAVAKFQLLRLHAQGDQRTFGAAKGEAPSTPRDAIKFKAKEVAPHTYVLNFVTLTPGEYGLLAPFSGDAGEPSERLGRLYTFRVGK